MAMRFRKSINLSQNTKINLNKNSVSFTAGTKHIHHTVSSNGSKTNSASIPGTGISFVDRSGGGSGRGSGNNSFSTIHNDNNFKDVQNMNKSEKQLKNNIIIFSVIAAILAFISLFTMPFGLLFIIIALVLLIPIIKNGKELNSRKTVNDEYSAPEVEVNNPYTKKTIIALIFLQPLGLYWMWVHTSWNKIFKAVISLLCVSAVLFNSLMIAAFVDPEAFETEPETQTTETASDKEKNGITTEPETPNRAIVPIKDEKESTTEETSSTTETSKVTTTTTTTITTTTATTTATTKTTTKSTTENKTTVADRNNNSIQSDFVGNVNSMVFHYSWCESVKKMKESNKYYFSGTSEQMRAKGYKPCQKCNP